MTRYRPSLVKLCALGLLCFALWGCVSGGDFVSREDTADSETIATYRPVGDGDTRIRYRLIRKSNKLACLEIDESNKQALSTTHWRDSDGDHFTLWISLLGKQGHAFEIVFPEDRTKDGTRYIYEPNAYTVLTVGGVQRPFPTAKGSHSKTILKRIPNSN